MGNQMDMRRTYRAWARSGGTRVLWKRSTRYVAPRRIVILWDVSGSMREMIPLYVPWLHRLLFTVRDAVAFAFGVGVADVTQALRQSYPRAVEALQEIPDVWDGGTSIGIALQDWDDHFGSVTCRGRTTVLIISDGWDSGRPEDVRAALRKISSRGVRLLWMHPLLQSPGFALKTRALEAAKPFVDAWIPGGSVDELRQCRIT